MVQLESEDAPKKASSVSTPPAKATAAAAPHAHGTGLDSATVLKKMSGMKPEQMPAMLGLMTGMYDSWKDKIGEANKKEHDQKEAYEKTIADLEKKKKQFSDSKDAMATYN